MITKSPDETSNWEEHLKRIVPVIYQGIYTFLDLPISTGNYDKNDHVSYIKQICRVLTTICKKSHVDKFNGVLAGPHANRTVIKKNPVYIY